jgi:hypothetical protein
LALRLWPAAAEFGLGGQLGTDPAASPPSHPTGGPQVSARLSILLTKASTRLAWTGLARAVAQVGDFLESDSGDLAAAESRKHVQPKQALVALDGDGGASGLEKVGSRSGRRQCGC